jgi:2-keto-4-pentenoate hydratase/2-oxohepta-3-ene-1,7-dioic acid hydratase in catechol pathway
MKFLRYGPKGQEIPAMLDATGGIRDLSAHVDDLAGDTVSIESLTKLSQLDPATLPLLPKGARIGACVADAPNFLCIGLNYAKHAVEASLPMPPEPIIFSKATSALTGPYDTILLPKGSAGLDWEVELGLVIGRPCSNVSEEDALDYVSGYFTSNDVSEREFQMHRGGQWVKGKSAPTFGPVGPYLVTPDEVSDPQNLAVSTKVNGRVMQDSNTADMIFSVRNIIATLSRYMDLRVGDLVITGTPEGVGMGMKPPVYLQPGDVVEVEVEGLGMQRATVS